jgi:hypothetical protein
MFSINLRSMDAYVVGVILWLIQSAALADNPIFYRVDISMDQVKSWADGPNRMDFSNPNGPRLPAERSKTRVTGFFMTDGTMGPIGARNILDYELNFSSTVAGVFNVRYNSRNKGKCDPNFGCLMITSKGAEMSVERSGEAFLEARPDGKLYLRSNAVYFSLMYSSTEVRDSHSFYRIRLNSSRGVDYVAAEARPNMTNRYSDRFYETVRPAGPIGVVMQVN